MGVIQEAAKEEKKKKKKKKASKKEEKNRTKPVGTILLLGVKNDLVAVLHEVLDGKVLVALDGEVLNADDSVNGNPDFVDLVFCQEMHELLDVTLLQFHGELLIFPEHLLDPEAELLLGTFDTQQIRKFLKEDLLDLSVLATELLQEGEALLADADQARKLFLEAHVNMLGEDVEDVGNQAAVQHNALVGGVGLGGVIRQRAKLDQLVKNIAKLLDMLVLQLDKDEASQSGQTGGDGFEDSHRLGDSQNTNVLSFGEEGADLGKVPVDHLQREGDNIGRMISGEIQADGDQGAVRVHELNRVLQGLEVVVNQVDRDFLLVINIRNKGQQLGRGISDGVGPVKVEA